MLSRQDVQLTEASLNLASSLRIIPVTFDPSSGRMRKLEGENSWKRELMFKFWCQLAVSHVLYMSFRLMNFVLFPENGKLSWDFIPIMITATVGIYCIIFTTLALFRTSLQENIKLYNETIRIRGKYSR